MTTDFLFARTSFFHGLARTLDLWGSLNFYNRSPTPEEDDARSMYLDWAMVGQDLSETMELFDARQGEQDEQLKLFEQHSR